MPKFEIGQKVYRKDTNYIQECEIVEYIPKYLDSVKGNPFLVYTNAYKVKHDDGNTAIVPERCLSEIN